MNEQEAIRTTREKTKNGLLSPFLGDPERGVDTFNTSTGDTTGAGSMLASVSFSVGEGLDTESITKRLFDAIQDFYESEDIMEDYDLVDIDTEEEGPYTTIYISTNLQPEYLDKLEKYLNENVLSKVDKEAYFDVDGHGTLITRVTEPQTLEEAIKYKDNQLFRSRNKHYQIEEQYNVIKEGLSSEDKRALQQFIERTDDPKQIEIYMKGLAHKNDR